MSFFDAVAEAVDGGVRLRAGAVDVHVAGAEGLPAEVTVGVRPESARAWDGAAAGALAGPVRGTVQYVEALGRETFLGVAVDGARLVVHEDGRTHKQPGDAIEFGIAPGALRFFDVATGRALALPPPRAA
jgi:ABC-type sugar transport system ATPase subunit